MAKSKKKEIDIEKIVKSVKKSTKNGKLNFKSALTLAVLFVFITVFALGYFGIIELPFLNEEPSYSLGSFSYEEIPEHSGEAYVILNDGIPYFNPDEYEAVGFEEYGELDDLGRCVYAFACVGPETMPTEDRGNIGSVKPSGWQSVEYDIIDGGWLYNRCHLIGFKLTGENANERNLITGTRYLNISGMVKFENRVADYIKETGNHVLYRVTPIFVGSELVARGVVIEAYSMEDGGEEICFNIFCYNVQPGIIINYSDGTSVGP